jgi:c-di-GMP-binding flagellar brake protein YcgR
MKDVSLQVNELLQVSFPQGESSRSYASRVEDLDQEKIHIAWPTDSGLRVPARAGDTLFLSFTREDAAYGVQVKVESARTSPVPILILEPEGPLQRTQRRENVRVYVRIPVELIGIPDPSAAKEHAAPVVLLVKTDAVDFSAGGMGILYKEAIQPGTVLECRFRLAGQPDPFHLPARVVRCASSLDLQRNRVFRIGLMFLDMSESLRSRIVRYVFTVQNSMIRR